jgi:hypothetical protein
MKHRLHIKFNKSKNTHQVGNLNTIYPSKKTTQ